LKGSQKAKSLTAATNAVISTLQSGEGFQQSIIVMMGEILSIMFKRQEPCNSNVLDKPADNEQAYLLKGLLQGLIINKPQRFSGVGLLFFVERSVGRSDSKMAQGFDSLGF